MIRSDLKLVTVARRHPFAAVCAVLSVLLAVAVWFLWQQDRELEAAHYVRSQEGDRMLSTLVSGPLLRQELALVKAYTRRVEDHLVTEDNRGENLSYFYAMEEHTKVHLGDLRQNPPAAPDGAALYKRIPYSLSVTGTYQQVALFMQEVETGPRLSLISSFSFRRQGPANPLVTLDLKIYLLGRL